MNQLSTITTSRLLIKSLSAADDAFIFELLNTAEWKRFIADRNIHSRADALAYIGKIAADPEAKYWVVKRKTDAASLGIVTLLKRTYLESHDIGFAFLPQFFGQGYAFEATDAVLREIAKVYALGQISAVTLPENHASIKLLNKLGLRLDGEIMVDGKKLQRYGLK